MAQLTAFSGHVPFFHQRVNTMARQRMGGWWRETEGKRKICYVTT